MIYLCHELLLVLPTLLLQSGVLLTARETAPPPAERHPLLRRSTDSGRRRQDLQAGSVWSGATPPSQLITVNSLSHLLISTLVMMWTIMTIMTIMSIMMMMVGLVLLNLRPCRRSERYNND